MKYLYVIEKALDGSYSAYVPDLPGCTSCGDTVDELKRFREERELGVILARSHAQIVEKVGQTMAIGGGQPQRAMPLLQLATPQQVDGMVVRHAEQPRQESAAAWLIRGRLPPELQERFLDNLFGG